MRLAPRADAAPRHVLLLDKHERRPFAAEGQRQLVPEVAAARVAARQHPLRDSPRSQRGDLLRLGRQPRRRGAFEHVVERQQPPQHHRRRRLAPVAHVLGPRARYSARGATMHSRVDPRPRPLDRRPPARLPPAPRAVPLDEPRRQHHDSRATSRPPFIRTRSNVAAALCGSVGCGRIRTVTSSTWSSFPQPDRRRRHVLGLLIVGGVRHLGSQEPERPLPVLADRVRLREYWSTTKR